MIRRPPRSTLFPLHDALPIWVRLRSKVMGGARSPFGSPSGSGRSEEHTSELQSLTNLVCRLLLEKKKKKQKDTADGGRREAEETGHLRPPGGHDARTRGRT